MRIWNLIDALNNVAEQKIQVRNEIVDKVVWSGNIEDIPPWVKNEQIISLDLISLDGIECIDIGVGSLF